MNRRTFFQASAAAGGGLLLALYVPRFLRSPAPKLAGFTPNAWLRLTPEGQAIFYLDKAEMGQGVITSLPMLLGEELDLAPHRFTIENAPAEKRYENPHFNLQVTGGSTSVAASWEPLRRAGALARQVLIHSAAIKWNVSPKECTTDDGFVMHAPSGKKAAYAELAVEAEKFTSHLDEPTLKTRAQHKYIGKPIGRIDARAKVTGTAEFGIDVKRPDMLVAVVVRPPQLGARAVSFVDEEAKKSPGFKSAFLIPQGIAVVATGYWEARVAAAKIVPKWETQNGVSDLSTKILRDKYEALAREEGKSTHKSGDFKKAFEGAAKKLEAVYEMPFLAHATMEPQNFTAHVTETSCDLWGPTQGAGLAQEVAAEITGLAHDQIKVHTTFMGGGFGRRLEQDYVAEAVYVAQKVRVPVKVMWSREDDTRHDYYRPASFHVLKAGLDAEGKPIAHAHRIVAQSLLSETVPKWLPTMAPEWIPGGVRRVIGRTAGSVFKGLVVDSTAVEGADVLPYEIEHVQNQFVRAETLVPTGFWRSVGHSYNGFVVESFIDELAHLAGKDPFEFRRGLLAKSDRHRRVLELAVEKAGWGKPLPAGVFRGVAQHASFGSFSAQVAEVRITADKEIRVERVVCAIDCGLVVNPDGLRAQVESGIIFGMAAALKGEITFEDGRVQQSNFHDFRTLHMNESPKIEVHIVESDIAPTGVGEVAVPPIGPAVGNAVFAATGQRFRKMPFVLA